MRPTGAVVAESVERRAGAKGNTHQQSTYWTQSQVRVSQALARIRQLVPSHTRGRSRMRGSRTYGSVRGACDETHVPTATPPEFMSSSERVPGRRRCEFEIADIRAQPYPHPRADRDQDDVVHRQRRHSQAADQVSRTLDAREALVDGVGGGQIVDKHHGARAVDAEVITK